ncbi:MAG: hypothetical protein JRF07_07100 [Deltaproteobacteria bacterium]|nr:hypothetical protein [Deltaproteobacteria bacterium]
MPRVFSDFPIGLQLWPEARRRPRILREGYQFTLLEDTRDTYHFSILTGMARVRQMFQKFAKSLPGEAFFILEFYTTEPNVAEEEQPAPTIHYSPYLPVVDILDAIEPYWSRLMNDGFVGFGLANNPASQEMFYSEEKILTCFTDNHIRLTNQLANLAIPHREELLTHTEMGHDHLSLLCLNRSGLSAELQSYNDRDLDYAWFCRELLDTLSMYPVEESLSFFFSRREQKLIKALLENHPEFSEFAEEDFGTLLLDWNDFVQECNANFEGDLWEYKMGLRLRDMIQFVIAKTTDPLSSRIREALSTPDECFRQNLKDFRKRLDQPGTTHTDDHFWYNGMIRNAGADLRRDLIRHGWYKP